MSREQWWDWLSPSPPGTICGRGRGGVSVERCLQGPRAPKHVTPVWSPLCLRGGGAPHLQSKPSPRTACRRSGFHVVTSDWQETDNSVEHTKVRKAWEGRRKISFPLHLWLQRPERLLNLGQEAELLTYVGAPPEQPQNDGSGFALPAPVPPSHSIPLDVLRQTSAGRVVGLPSLETPGPSLPASCPPRLAPYGLWRTRTEQDRHLKPLKPD